MDASGLNQKYEAQGKFALAHYKVYAGAYSFPFPRRCLRVYKLGHRVTGVQI